MVAWCPAAVLAAVLAVPAVPAPVPAPARSVRSVPVRSAAVNTNRIPVVFRREILLASHQRERCYR